MNASAGTAGNAETAIALAAGLWAMLVAAAVAPHDRVAFAANFAFFLGEQALVLLPLLLQRPRGAVLGGATTAVALGLLATVLWGHWTHVRENWVLFVLAMPGALLGAVVAGVMGRRWRRRSAGFAAGGAAVVVLIPLTLAAASAEIFW